MKGEYSLKYINKVVNRFQEPNTSLAKIHYNDLIHTSLVIHNELVGAVRRGNLKGDLMRKVLETSKVIEETTLMEQRMRGDINMYVNELFDWHVHEDNTKMTYRIPTMAKTFDHFRKKRSKIKDCAIEIVTKMYLIDQEDRVAVKLEINKVKQGY